MIDPIFVQLFHDYTQDLYFDDISRKNLPDDYIKSILKKKNESDLKCCFKRSPLLDEC